MTSDFQPAGGGVYRVKPGEKVVTPRMKADDAPPGLCHLVAVAVESGESAADFSFLADPDPKGTLARTRGEPGAEQTLRSPFGRLLLKALYGEGDTQSLDVATIRRVGLFKQPVLISRGSVR